MFIIDRNENRVKRLEPGTFSELGFRERTHLQEWIAKDPDVLGEPLLIIQKEFSGFNDTSERLDLLALDKKGNLVVIENKLDDSGRDVTWQALKYASYCSTLTKDQIRSIYQQYLSGKDNPATAEDRICEFLEATDYEELELNSGLTQRIILIAAKFRKEVTSTVLWLLNHKLRIQCFKATPYVHGEQLLLNVEQIIPMRDAQEYIIGMVEKNREDAEAQSTKQRRHAVRRGFWGVCLAEMNRRSTLFQNVNPQESSWIGTGSGTSSISYTLLATGKYVRAELSLNRATAENKALFDGLYARRAEIDSAFGGDLIWDRMDGRQACRIAAEAPANIFEQEQWSSMADFLTDAMIRLEKAIKPHLAREVTALKAR